MANSPGMMVKHHPQENAPALTNNELITSIVDVLGTSGADIIQQIRTASGKLLTLTIGHDNKEEDDVTKSRIEKEEKRESSPRGSNAYQLNQTKVSL